MRRPSMEDLHTGRRVDPGVRRRRSRWKRALSGGLQSAALGIMATPDDEDKNKGRDEIKPSDKTDVYASMAGNRLSDILGAPLDPVGTLSEQTMPEDTFANVMNLRERLLRKRRA